MNAARAARRLLVPAAILASGLAGASPLLTARLLAQSRVTVSGDVKNPGEYPYEDGLTVGAVLEKAGGINGESVRKILILRLRAGGPPVSANPDAILATISQVEASNDAPLLAGDELNVSAYKTDFVAPGARKIVNWISKGEFDNVTLAYFGQARAATFEATLRKQWLALEKQLGTFQQQVDTRTDVRGTQYAGVVTCEFSRGRGNVTVVFNRDGTTFIAD
jgi:hypothetical protein